jgi:hypothetical protein
VKGYSYTTISMKPDQIPSVGLYVYPDEHARVSFIPGRDTSGSFIAIDFANSRFHVGLTSETRVTDVHVTFARGLFDAAARFLADCERLRDEHATESSEQATPGKVA